MKSETILEVKNLVASFDTEAGRVRAVDDVSFSLKRGQTLGIVGESGCGKSVTALSIMRLLPRPSGFIEKGSIRYDGKDLAHLPADDLHTIRGRRIAMIFQEPMTALNPVHRIGRQLTEVFQLHFPAMTNGERRAEAIRMLEQVGIPDPEKRMGEYPHQLSGGMRQRVMISIALAAKPEILIADEPTTALDVTIQAQILALIKKLQRETGMALIFITHDLGVIAEICDDVVVMYAGKVAETAPAKELFKAPRHPYTKGLLLSIPLLSTQSKSTLYTIEGMVPSLTELPPACRFENRCPLAQPVCAKELPLLQAVGEMHHSACHFHEAVETLSHEENSGSPAGLPQAPATPVTKGETCLTVRGLKQYFPIHGGVFQRKVGDLKAVDDVSFSVRKGETVGIVGESGCGKTTLGRSLLRLYNPTAGEVFFEGENLAELSAGRMKTLRQQMQMIFQDPFESLNPRHTIGQILEEPFVIHGVKSKAKREKNVAELLKRVGLSSDAATRFPHEFSGGQRQRIGVARAIALAPRLIICDEPVSALDVSIQSQILNLLLRLQRELSLTFLFIAHDLSVVKHISDRIAVMYLGKIVEYADADRLYENPLHPYTRALISSIPIPDPSVRRKRTILEGELPSPANPPSGCNFRTRCPIAIDRCKIEEPQLFAPDGEGQRDHVAACHRSAEAHLFQEKHPVSPV